MRLDHLLSKEQPHPLAFGLVWCHPGPIGSGPSECPNVVLRVLRVEHRLIALPGLILAHEYDNDSLEWLCGKWLGGSGGWSDTLLGPQGPS